MQTFMELGLVMLGWAALVLIEIERRAKLAPEERAREDEETSRSHGTWS